MDKGGIVHHHDSGGRAILKDNSSGRLNKLRRQLPASRQEKGPGGISGEVVCSFDHLPLSSAHCLFQKVAYTSSPETTRPQVFVPQFDVRTAEMIRTKVADRRRTLPSLNSVSCCLTKESEIDENSAIEEDIAAVFDEMNRLHYVARTDLLVDELIAKMRAIIVQQQQRLRKLRMENSTELAASREQVKGLRKMHLKQTDENKTLRSDRDNLEAENKWLREEIEIIRTELSWHKESATHLAKSTAMQEEIQVEVMGAKPAVVQSWPEPWSRCRCDVAGSQSGGPETRKGTETPPREQEEATEHGIEEFVTSSKGRSNDIGLWSDIERHTLSSESEQSFESVSKMGEQCRETVDAIQKQASQIDTAIALDQLDTAKRELEAVSKKLEGRSSEVDGLHELVNNLESRLASMELERDLLQAEATHTKEDLKACVRQMAVLNVASSMGRTPADGSSSAIEFESSQEDLQKASLQVDKIPKICQRPATFIPTLLDRSKELEECQNETKENDNKANPTVSVDCVSKLPPSSPVFATSDNAFANSAGAPGVLSLGFRLLKQHSRWNGNKGPAFKRMDA